MKLREIFRFEFAYQVRRVSTWLYFAVLVFFAFVQSTDSFLADARNGDHFLGAPFVIAARTVVGCLLWLLVAAYVAGDAAARDVETGMHPLTYTAPVSKADYLGGRFLAAFVLNALILLAVPAGILLAVYSPERGGRDPRSVPAGGLPHRLRLHRVAERLRRHGDPVLVRGTQPSRHCELPRRPAPPGHRLRRGGGVALLLERELGQLLDPIGVIAFDDLTNGWTPIEKNTRLIALEGSLAREPPPVARHRSGHARVHLLPLSLRLIIPRPRGGVASCDDAMRTPRRLRAPGSRGALRSPCHRSGGRSASQPTRARRSPSRGHRSGRS